MALSDVLVAVNPLLVLLVGWFIRQWALEVREHRTRDCLRLQRLEADVAYLKGQLSGLFDDHNAS